MGFESFLSEEVLRACLFVLCVACFCMYVSVSVFVCVCVHDSSHSAIHRVCKLSVQFRDVRRVDVESEWGARRMREMVGDDVMSVCVALCCVCCHTFLSPRVPLLCLFRSSFFFLAVDSRIAFLHIF